MGISLYYTAMRNQPLTADERAAINSALSRFPVGALIAECPAGDEAFNGEEFHMYRANEYSEPGAVFEGATKLPTNSEGAFWAAIQYWLRLLSEVRRVLPGAAWCVSV